MPGAGGGLNINLLQKVAEGRPEVTFLEGEETPTPTADIAGGWQRTVAGRTEGRSCPVWSDEGLYEEQPNTKDQF